MELNRRETLTLSASAAAAIGIASPTKAANIVFFPEPAICVAMREIEGLSDRAYWLRVALLDALERYRLFEAHAREGDPNKHPSYDEAEFQTMRRPASAIIRVTELTHFKRKSDKRLQELSGHLRSCNFFFQVPPDHSGASVHNWGEA